MSLALKSRQSVFGQQSPLHHRGRLRTVRYRPSRGWSATYSEQGILDQAELEKLHSFRFKGFAGTSKSTRGASAGVDVIWELCRGPAAADRNVDVNRNVLKKAKNPPTGGSER